MKVINGQLNQFKGEVDQVLRKTFLAAHSQPVTSKSQIRLDRIWTIISGINRLHSKVRDNPVDDLKEMNEKVEQTKNQTFGISYFTSDPYRCFELGYSVFGVTKDGSGHAQHFRNVFEDTHDEMRVI